MKINKYWLTTLLFLALTSTALAQAKIDRKIERLTQELSLSEEQQTVVRNTFENAMNSCHASTSTHQDFRACMKEQRENVQATISSVLDEEQQVAFQTLREERKNKKGKRGNRKRDPRF